ncbi:MULTISPECIES: Dabb family protein [Desulfococcus]|uniref:Stress responsive alpha-beta barrel domain-containing protein n=1 Tax=Desulfococcus multivorans DSM 2059 TaxID=1121405 RepID=S7TVQ1_DESML|nr:Dabb family protein [Desulfococcus multivorans]AOY60330.1 stress responsive alpha-beta barrel domain protein [Desulfococcus multivorans]AQV02435.1 stress responsive alpha-beta barrel domain-containing protein [Desulfococcus multivorans]EPR41116.1 Stress responsive alpha-beta barrel domain-containing protein [Desulfococcus multivorans DSM 2059]SJZ59019.1 Stress responsive A/B Barrel Domain [Desulfococcus multivorans DSM 2059]
MIRHLVFLKFKTDVAQGAIAEIEAGLAALPGVIPEIRYYDFGRDVMRSPRSYDFALVSLFDDLDALKRYSEHPSHQAVLQKILAATEQIAAVDFETDTA